MSEFTQSRTELDDTSSSDEQKDLGRKTKMSKQEMDKKLDENKQNLLGDKQNYEAIIEDLKQRQPETNAQQTNNQIILNLQNQLNEKETEIHENKEKIKEKYKLLEAQTREITNETIANLRSVLIEKENVIQELEQKLKEEASKYLSVLETKKNEQPNDIATLQDKLREKEMDIRDLEKNNKELKEEASRYQSALGAATNVRLGNDDQNHSVQLKQDIIDLQRTLDNYVTNLKGNININVEEVNILIKQSGCHNIITQKKLNKPFVKAVLQRKVLDQIFEISKNYGESQGENFSLEYDIDLKAQELLSLIKEFSETRVGIDEVSKVATIKIRQQIYRILGNRGFSNIISPQDNSIRAHNFIDFSSRILNETINQYRQINDIENKNKVENMASKLICDVFKIFWFRFLVQEPKPEIKFFESNTMVHPDLMNGRWEADELDKICVDLCYFPLIGRDLNSNYNYKVITPAKIVTRPIVQSGTYEEENEQLNEEEDEGNEEIEPDKVVDGKNSSFGKALKLIKKKMRSNSK
ncbi:6283_t:CDS:2 [Funneliformis geosporum]|uniref:11030_t:CDS:1 n=1 Tax=Funneliformis geosporum TaxID=1117311 RepID=A0A9W4SMV8_9GLOM|nr:11030_t:CDS:2 [Funneliformis geosporum]CAI2174834.1 6283_t:CDS:2 [Funneliformis geosporum]